MKIIKHLLIFSILILAYQLSAQEKANKLKSNPLTIGESVVFESEIMGETRMLNVYLPQGYSKDSLSLYPIIYLLDGSMDEDFIHISGLVQFGSFSWINMIPESIVVGIANIDRKRDFTFPTNNKKDKEYFPTTGESEKFITFIEKELQPFIENRYMASTTKTLIGQSLGGLLATEILFKKPHLFDNYIIVSPSIWWDDESLLKLNPKDYKSEKSIYIAVGKEGEQMERTAKELYEKLQKRKKENSKLFFKFLEDQDHGDALHLATYDAFEKIFRQEKE